MIIDIVRPGVMFDVRPEDRAAAGGVFRYPVATHRCTPRARPATTTESETESVPYSISTQ